MKPVMVTTTIAKRQPHDPPGPPEWSIRMNSPTRRLRARSENTPTSILPGNPGAATRAASAANAERPCSRSKEADRASHVIGERTR